MNKKRIIAFVVLLFFIINVGLMIFPLLMGKAQGEYTNLMLMVDNKMINYNQRTVYIKHNGNEIKTDVPPLVFNDRVLVPVRAIFEAVSGNLEWNSETQIATIYSNNNTIKLAINSDTAVVNGVNVKLDSPAKLINERTFVPVRFISEKSGLNVEWDGNSRTVLITNKTPSTFTKMLSVTSSLNQTEDVYSVFVNTNNNDFVFSREFLKDSRKLVMDFKNTTNNITEFLFNENKFLYNIRHSNYSTNPQTSRVVFEIKPNVLYDIQDMNNGKRVDFIIKRGNISNIEVAHDNTINIIMSNGKSPSTSNLDNPKRLIIDFPDTDLSFPNNTISLENKIIKEIRVSKRENGVRVVVEYKREDASYSISESSTLVKVKNTAPGVNVDPKPLGEKIVVIDPGHGGSDPGAVGKEEGKPDLLEKDLNLKIALRVEQYLKEAGIQVYMTRKTDVAVGLSQRAEFANNLNADLFVSVHNNSSTSSSPSGTMAMYAYNDAKEGKTMSGKTFALILQKHMVNAIGKRDYGPVQNEKLAVCWRTNMPAVITESLFLSNKEDRALLRDDAVLDKIARAIADGIIEALNLI